MANFPIYITPNPPRPLTPYGLKKPLDFSPLLKSIQYEKALDKSGKTKDTKEDAVEGRQGAVNQFYANVNEAEQNLQDHITKFGDAAYTHPEYENIINAANLATSPQYTNTVSREQEAFVKARDQVNKLQSGGNYYIPDFISSDGLNIVTNSKKLSRQEYAPTTSLPGFTLDPENPYYYYDPNFTGSESYATDQHVRKELDRIYKGGDNQMNTEYISNKIALKTIEGLGLPGVPAISTTSEERTSDAKNLQKAAQDAISVITGGDWDGSDPLVSGLVQGFLAETGAAKTDYEVTQLDKNKKFKKNDKGKYLKEIVSLRNEDGTVNWENFQRGLHEYSYNKINNYYDKYSNVNLEENEKINEINDSSNAYKRSVDFTTKVPHVRETSNPYLTESKKMVIGINEPDVARITNFVQSYGKDEFNEDPDTSDNVAPVLKRITREDGTDVIVANNDYNKREGNNITAFQPFLPMLKKDLQAIKDGNYDLSLLNENKYQYISDKFIQYGEEKYLDYIKKTLIDKEPTITKAALDGMPPEILKEQFQIIASTEELEAAQNFESGLFENFVKEEEGSISAIEDVLKRGDVESVNSAITKTFMVSKALDYPLTPALSEDLNDMFKGKKMPANFVFKNTASHLVGTPISTAGFPGYVASINSGVTIRERAMPSNAVLDRDGNYALVINGEVTDKASFVSGADRGYVLPIWSPPYLKGAQAHKAANDIHPNTATFGEFGHYVNANIVVEGEAGAKQLYDFMTTVKVYDNTYDFNPKEIQEKVDTIKRISEAFELKEDEDGEVEGFKYVKSGGLIAATKKIVNYKNNSSDFETMSDDAFAKKYKISKRDAQEYREIISKFQDDRRPNLTGTKYIPGGIAHLTDQGVANAASEYIRVGYLNRGMTPKEVDNLKSKAKLQNLLSTDDLNFDDFKKAIKNNTLYQHMGDKFVRALNITPKYDSKGVLEQIRYIMPVDASVMISRSANNNLSADYNAALQANQAESPTPATKEQEAKLGLLNIIGK